MTIQRGKNGENPSRGAFGGSGKTDEHNECRALDLNRMYPVTSLQTGPVANLYFPLRFEAEQGTPVCFVSASDPRVQNVTEDSSERFKRDICAEVQLLPCGVHRCKVRNVNHG